MKIKLLENFQGRETGDNAMEAGQILDMDSRFALPLIQNGVAEAVLEQPEIESIEPEPVKPKRGRKPK